MENKPEIIVKARSNDYKAYIEGDEGYWGVGKTQSEAVGDLVRSFPEKFGVEIRYDN